MVKASEVKVGQHIVLFGNAYPVFKVSISGTTVMLTIDNTPFVSSNFASFNVNDNVEVY